MARKNTPTGAAHDVQRATEDARLAEEAGFTLPATVVPFGTAVIALGVDRYRQSHAEWDALPAALTMLRDFGGRIAAERRTDPIVAVRDLSMSAFGELQGPVGAPRPLSLPAWRQLANFGYTVEGEDRRRRLLPTGAATYLSDPATPLSRRGTEISYHCRQAHPAAQARVRCRTREDQQEVWAVLSPAYQTDCDADKVAGELGRGTYGLVGAKGQALYDGHRWTLDLLWHSDLPIGESPVAGEIFRAGVRITSADDGSAGIRVKAILWRNLCLNFGIIGTAEQESYTTHRRKSLAAWLREHVSKALDSTKGFARQWGDAHRQKLLGEARTQPAEAFGKLVDLGFLAAPEGSGLTAKDYVERLVTAYRAEGGYTADPKHIITVADGYNAVSRAHMHTWASPWMVQDQQEQAGALYQRVAVWGQN